MLDYLGLGNLPLRKLQITGIIEGLPADVSRWA